jgi:hypothetical protein
MDARPKPPKRPKLVLSPTSVPFIFYLHFAIVYVTIVLFWCYLFFHDHFVFPEKSDLKMIWNVQAMLFCGMPLAICLAGLLARVKFRTWITYVIVDLIIGLLSSVWVFVVSGIVMFANYPK